MRFSFAAFLIIFFLLLAGFVNLSLAQQQKARYVGVAKCRNCHESKAKGAPYTKWKESKHGVAFETLASEQSKEAALKLGLQDPRKADKCLKCHVTAFGAAKEDLDEKFNNENVQCEQCHGPGEIHVKARLKAAAQEEDEGGDDLFGEGEQERIKLPEGEITTQVQEKVCTSCHNPESPTYKEWNFEEALKKTAHPDPRPKPK